MESKLFERNEKEGEGTRILLMAVLVLYCTCTVRCVDFLSYVNVYMKVKSQSSENMVENIKRGSCLKKEKREEVFLSSPLLKGEIRDKGRSQSAIMEI